ncbi:hypothetical protein [Brevundimonas sp. A19_0]|uniref:hypothetical protein n=1 Tax=Brevundimonas sp. A19_0 TaxID=2821087 RepID=UPI001ADA42FA|nr:hypothetical protein [Brevundimonas sp. A19_0]MBO9502505.1 hypothetical protein [Brevundimonas sp. A19_0]
MAKPVARPSAPPRATRADVVAMVSKAYPDAQLPEVYVVGVRGYYRDGLGKVGENDRGIYDDAIFVLAPGIFAAFNANTDPSRVRKGKGTGAGKGMARLKAGVWPSYELGTHRAGTRSAHQALVQRAGPVTVTRDGTDGDYDHTGHFGINIHKGGVTTTGSEGCQTIPPDQWEAFMALIRRALSAARQTRVTYVLIEEQG